MEVGLPPKSIVVGSNGFIGSAFIEALSTYYPEVIGTSRRGFPALDLANPQLDFELKGSTWALIAAGYATPQRCVKDAAYCRTVDLDGVVNLSKQFLQQGVTPVILSTSHVFSGEEPIYYPHSKTSPVNAYGKLHAQRETQLLRELDGECLILRLCRVYTTNHGVPFEIMNQLAERGEISAATDQILQLVGVDAVISCIFELQQQERRGIFQICPKDWASRYMVACYIADLMGYGQGCVKPICMSEIDDISRPKYIHMESCNPVRSWKEGVKQVVKRYTTIST